MPSLSATASALLSLPAVALTSTVVAAQDEYSPRVEASSDEGLQAMSKLELAEGIEASLWAAEPLLANPVCLYVDNQGALYVAETFRHHAGVTDMRNHMRWLDEDLAARSVDDRRAMFQRNEDDEGYASYAKEHERVRRIVDSDGDGRADSATVFADGFNDHAAGIGAGLLTHGGDLYYTCIPHLWRLRDEDRDGYADKREVLSEGYGVHVALLGHDLHGLRVGPDGKLYFSCGDRGFRVETENGVIEHTHAGAVLRCNMDGTGLEVFARWAAQSPGARVQRVRRALHRRQQLRWRRQGALGERHAGLGLGLALQLPMADASVDARAVE